MYLRTLSGTVGAVIILAACASAGTAPLRHGPADRITQEQIQQYKGDNVYLLIQSYHATWLQPRGRTSLSGPVTVYIDEMPQPDGVDSLRTLKPFQVKEIRYLDSREATSRFGTGHSNGAIMVTLR